MRGMQQRPTEDRNLADSAPRRTWLAAERTYLAWLRTGLGALGLALAVGRLLPALVDADHTAFGVLGAGYGVLGVFVLVLGAYRAQRVRNALAAGLPVPADFWEIWALTAFSMALAVATIALVLAGV
jgi:putative membrane protein